MRSVGFAAAYIAFVREMTFPLTTWAPFWSIKTPTRSGSFTLSALGFLFVYFLFNVTNITTSTTTTTAVAGFEALGRVQLGAYFCEVMHGGDKIHHVLVVRGGDPSCPPTSADLSIDCDHLFVRDVLIQEGAQFFDVLTL
jgi:hypothetical protein